MNHDTHHNAPRRALLGLWTRAEIWMCRGKAKRGLGDFNLPRMQISRITL